VKIIDFIDVSDLIKKYLRIKKVPHFTTIQKFFKRLPSKQIREINRLILSLNDIKADIIALDGSGFTNDYADKYYAKNTAKRKKKLYKKPFNNRRENASYFILSNITWTKI